MNKEIADAERAELIQNIKALFIPLFLFLSCVIFAAGAFLLYSEEPAGWGFVIVSMVVSISCIVALIRFQNGFRARGIVPSDLEVEADKN